MKKRILILTLILLVSAWANAQSPVDCVKKYNKLVVGYLINDDVEMRDEIDDLLRGGRNKCYISNTIGQDMARERNIEVQLMHSDTYHNMLLNWYKNGVIRTFELNNIEWHRDWVEPRIKTENNDSPILFVSAGLHTSGSRPYNSSDLFYVQDGHIVSIEDLGSGGLGNAIRLYNQKKYDEAFNLFRSIAYTNRNAYKARYYTAVMLITGKGCKNIDKKVRDNDAAWLGLSGYLSGDEDLSALARKFSMTLPFSESNIIHFAPAYNGRRIIKKGHDKFGIIDDSGRMILPFRKGYAGPLSCSGLAIISEPGSKNGLIDSDGNIVLPYDYNNVLPYIYNDKIYAIKNDNLILLSKTGVVLKNIPGAFTHLLTATKDGHIVVVNGGKHELYNFDGQIVMDSNDFDSWNLNKVTGLLQLLKGKTVIKSLYAMW